MSSNTRSNKIQRSYPSSKVYAEDDIEWELAERGIIYSQGETAVVANHKSSSTNPKYNASKATNAIEKTPAPSSYTNNNVGNDKDTSPSSCNVCWGCQKLTALIIGIVIVICVGVGVAAFMDHTNVLDGRNGFGPGLPPRDVTMEELALHDSADDCWVIYYGEVYDMTEYAQRHPGGASIITNLAGTDATEAYENFHSQRLLKTVMGTKIGPLVASTGAATDTAVEEPCSATTTSMTKALQSVSLEELQQHNTADDCWVIYDGYVYDMTSYAKRHPGGSRIITKYAGTDATSAYKKFHKLSLLKTVQNTRIGPLSSTSNGTQADEGGTTGCNTGNVTPTITDDDIPPPSESEDSSD